MDLHRPVSPKAYRQLVIRICPTPHRFQNIGMDLRAPFGTAGWVAILQMQFFYVEDRNSDLSGRES